MNTNDQDFLNQIEENIRSKSNEQDDARQELALLENEMWQASEDLDFEKAANLRDAIRELEARIQGVDLKLPALPNAGPRETSRKSRRARA